MLFEWNSCVMTRGQCVLCYTGLWSEPFSSCRRIMWCHKPQSFFSLWTYWQNVCAVWCGYLQLYRPSPGNQSLTYSWNLSFSLTDGIKMNFGGNYWEMTYSEKIDCKLSTGTQKLDSKLSTKVHVMLLELMMCLNCLIALLQTVTIYVGNFCSQWQLFMPYYRWGWRHFVFLFIWAEAFSDWLAIDLGS